ncbi:MAG: hypothetical protein V4736_15330 [Bdellovibrionota bacterium]
MKSLLIKLTTLTFLTVATSMASAACKVETCVTPNGQQYCCSHLPSENGNHSQVPKPKPVFPVLINSKAHAGFYECTSQSDASDEVVLQLSLNADGSANYDSKGLNAVGNYTTVDSHCPGRLCGQWNAKIKFPTIFQHEAGMGKIGHVDVQLIQSSLSLDAWVGHYYVDGRAPSTISVSCKKLEY